MSTTGTAAAFLVMVIKAQTVVLPMPSLAVCEQARADRAIQSQGSAPGSPRDWLNRTFCVPARQGMKKETAAVAELRRAVRNIPEKLRVCGNAVPSAPKPSAKEVVWLTIPQDAKDWLVKDPSFSRQKAFDKKFGRGRAAATLCKLGFGHKVAWTWIDLPIPSPTKR